MARRDTSPDFIEALARGLDVIRAFQPRQPVMSLAAVAAAAGLARPTARRILLTLEQMGYVRAADGEYELTPRVLELGMSYVLSRNLWDVARPHMERLVARTHESSSIAQLDGLGHRLCGQGRGPEDRRAGGDHRHQVPGDADLAGQGAAGGAAAGGGGARARRAEPVRDHPAHRCPAARSGRPRCGRSGRAAGRSPTSSWPPGIRSVAAPLRDGEGRVIASLNVNTHAAETPVEVLTGEYLPLLLQTAGAISADWAACQAAPQITVPQPAAPQPAPQPLALP